MYIKNQHSFFPSHSNRGFEPMYNIFTTGIHYYVQLFHWNRTMYCYCKRGFEPLTTIYRYSNPQFLLTNMYNVFITFSRLHFWMKIDKNGDGFSLFAAAAANNNFFIFFFIIIYKCRLKKLEFQLLISVTSHYL